MHLILSMSGGGILGWQIGNIIGGTMPDALLIVAGTVLLVAGVIVAIARA